MTPSMARQNIEATQCTASNGYLFVRSEKVRAGGCIQTSSASCSWCLFKCQDRDRGGRCSLLVAQDKGIVDHIPTYGIVYGNVELFVINGTPRSRCRNPVSSLLIM